VGPGTEMGKKAQLGAMVVIQRGGDESTVLDPEDALDTLMANCDDAYGFPPYPVIQDFLPSRNGRDLRAAERRTTASALTGVPATLLESSTMNWWEHLPRLVDAMHAPTVTGGEGGMETVQAGGGGESGRTTPGG